MSEERPLEIAPVPAVTQRVIHAPDEEAVAASSSEKVFRVGDLINVYFGNQAEFAHH